MLAAMGLTVSDVFRLMIRVAKDEALPFEPLVPNAKSIAAIKEARRGKLPRHQRKHQRLPEVARCGRLSTPMPSNAIISVEKKGQLGGKLDALPGGVDRWATHGCLLPPKYKDHPLSGKWNDCRDCHVRPDLILIYRKRGTTCCSLCASARIVNSGSRAGSPRTGVGATLGRLEKTVGTPETCPTGAMADRHNYFLPVTSLLLLMSDQLRLDRPARHSERWTTLATRTSCVAGTAPAPLRMRRDVCFSLMWERAYLSLQGMLVGYSAN